MARNISLSRISVAGQLSASPIIARDGVACFAMRYASISRSFASAIDSAGGACISRSLFSRFLSPAFNIRLSSTSVYHQYVSYLTANPSAACTFDSCVFIYMNAESTGGAVLNCSNAVAATFTSCNFQNCFSYNYPAAGALFTNGNLSVTQCCFNNVSKLYQGADSLTNVIYMNSANLSIDLSSFIYSSTDNYNGGDSTIYATTSLISAQRMNFTQCHGYNGAASGRFDSSLSGSTVNFVNVLRCGQYGTFEVWSSEYLSPNYFNVINNTQYLTAWMYINTANTTLTSFIFALNPYMGSNTFIVRNSGSMTLVNCISDYSNITSCTYFASPQLISMASLFTRGCQMNLTTYKFTADQRPLLFSYTFVLILTPIVMCFD